MRPLQSVFLVEFDIVWSMIRIVETETTDVLAR